MMFGIVGGREDEKVAYPRIVGVSYDVRSVRRSFERVAFARVASASIRWLT